MQNEIAVRLYINEKYGTTYGKGLVRRALFNGTADLQNPQLKYLLDFYKLADWQHTAKTDNDMEILTHVMTRGNAQETYSWIVRYDPVSKSKTRVPGFCAYDMDENTLTLLVMDEAEQVENTWQLDVKPCSQNARNKNAPHLLATNADDLNAWH